MKIQFFGAVRTTTGSMHVVEVNGSRILLDCGLFQGRRKEAFERNRNFPIDPPTIDVCVLSHAHIDHSGNLPTLVSRGYKGPIYATPATRDLCEIMLADSAWLQVQDVKYVNRKRKRKGKKPFEPLYSPEDVPAVLEALRPHPYEQPVEIAPGVTLTFLDAGHILGSAFVQLDITEDGRTRRLLFTGDIGRPDMPILQDPAAPVDVDLLITESTYGNRLHPTTEDIKAELAELCAGTMRKSSRLVIPSFSVGRTQQMLYFLNELSREGAIDGLPIYVDSPLSTKATNVHRRHPECFDDETAAFLYDGNDPFWFDGLQMVADVDDSKKLNATDGPLVIVSASGMCEGGRILHHLKHAIQNENNDILFVGYQAQHTLGRRIRDGADTIRIFGDEFEQRAGVHAINALSAHADRDEMARFIKPMAAGLSHTWIVHGEEEANEAMAENLAGMNIPNITIPEREAPYEV